MKYMLMVMDDERFEAALPPAEIDRLVARHTAFGRALREHGQWVSAARLRYSREATTIRRHADGGQVVHDGPFAESKEALGGFYLIEAASKADAIERAKQVPMLERGGVEVRPARTGATWRGAVHDGQQYAVLFIADAHRPLARDEIFDAIDSHYELSLELAAQGKFVSSRSLEPSPAATAIRWQDGRHMVSDGPFLETKEFVAGYFVIACPSKDEAMTWAARLMRGSAGCEVRPLWGA
jgi:hypothetical protein